MRNDSRKTKRYAAGVALAAALAQSPAAAETQAGRVHFVLWNNGPGQSFDPGLWSTAVTLAAKGRDYISIFTTDPARIPAALEMARAEPVPGTVIVLSTAQVATTDTDVFAGFMTTMDADQSTNAGIAGAVTLLHVPLCRVMHLPLKPVEYAPVGLVLTGTDPDRIIDCYAALADKHMNRAAGFDHDADGNRIVAVDETADFAQNAMPAAYSMGWKLLGPDGEARDSNRFAPGEEIVIETTLDYIRKSDAGYPGAAYRIGLDIEIKDMDGALIQRMDDVYLYGNEMRHRVPVDADYFRNWLTASVRLTQAGAYQVDFIFTDLNAPEGKQVPVAVTADVVIE